MSGRLISSLTGLAFVAVFAAAAMAGGPPEFVVRFDPKKGELPEGLAVRDGTLVVGFAPQQRIVEVAGDGSFKTYAQLPKGPAGKTFLTGLAFDPDGNLYGNLVSFTDEATKGVYKVSAGGAVSLLVTDPGFGFLNGIVWHRSGYLFATDSAHGRVYRLAPDGGLQVWAESPLLKGDKDACPPAEREFGLGANGLAFGGDGALYIGVTDRAQIVRIPMRPDGSAAQATIFAGPDCGRLEGMDGAATGPDGKVYMTSNHHNTILRLDGPGAVSVVAGGGDLDFPASIAFGGKTLYIANFALGSVMANSPSAKPGVMKMVP